MALCLHNLRSVFLPDTFMYLFTAKHNNLFLTEENFRLFYSKRLMSFNSWISVCRQWWFLVFVFVFFPVPLKHTIIYWLTKTPDRQLVSSSILSETNYLEVTFFCLGLLLFLAISLSEVFYTYSSVLIRRTPLLFAGAEISVTLHSHDSDWNFTAPSVQNLSLKT